MGFIAHNCPIMRKIGGNDDDRVFVNWGKKYQRPIWERKKVLETNLTAEKSKITNFITHERNAWA